MAAWSTTAVSLTCTLNTRRGRNGGKELLVGRWWRSQPCVWGIGCCYLSAHRIVVLFCCRPAFWACIVYTEACGWSQITWMRNIIPTAITEIPIFCHTSCCFSYFTDKQREHLALYILRRLTRSFHPLAQSRIGNVAQTVRSSWSFEMGDAFLMRMLPVG